MSIMGTFALASTATGTPLSSSYEKESDAMKSDGISSSIHNQRYARWLLIQRCLLLAPSARLLTLNRISDPESSNAPFATLLALNLSVSSISTSKQGRSSWSNVGGRKGLQRGEGPAATLHTYRLRVI